ncbi:MAG: ribonuclease P protein component [Clostridiales bacterium GWC2_40_7]|nr:MAG: ribonuclease P protein component [Clostridiales bacterium GWC2_40_7]
MDKTVSLKKNYEFMRLYKKGKFFVGKYLVLYVKRNNTKNNRLGITVNKKVGKAVRRNRIKRLIKECYRHYEVSMKDGCDLVFVARSSELMPGYLEINREMKFLLKKMDVFMQDVKND